MRALVALALLMFACATPTPESARPTGMAIRVDGGKSYWEANESARFNGNADSWNLGMSMFWNFEYPEEEEEE